MRNNLVFALICRDCGQRLNLEMGGDTSLKGSEDPKLPTGACNLVLGAIRVVPCDHCVGKLKRSARKIREGLAELGEGSE